MKYKSMLLEQVGNINAAIKMLVNTQPIKKITNMHMHFISCFGTSSTSGSTALVITNTDLSKDTKLEFSKISKISACAFINNMKDPLVDFFYPHGPSPLCLHAALAVGHVYFKYFPQTSVCQLTTQNKVTINIDKVRYNSIRLELYQQKIPKLALDFQKIPDLLELEPKYIVEPITVASVGSPKLLVKINDKTILDKLKPNLKLIKDWSDKNEINGCYVYYQSDKCNITGRNFNHLDPTLEDPATGVAAAALSYHLRSDLIISQGTNLLNPCLMRTYYCPISDKVYLVGSAIEVAEPVEDLLGDLIIHNFYD